MIKLALGYIFTGLLTVFLAVSDSFWSNLPMTIISIGTFIVTAGGFFWKIMQEVRANRKEMKVISGKIDGLLDQKEAADIALGTLKGIEDAKAEEAIRNKVRVEMMREQELRNQQPPGSQKVTITDDDKRALEKQIEKQGDKIQETVKDKVEEIKTEVPVVTADKVIDKLDNKDKK